MVDQEVTSVVLRSGERVCIRRLTPADAPLYRALIARLDARSRQMRFFVGVRDLPGTVAHRLTHPDFDRHFAFLATRPGPDGSQDACGVVRLHVDETGTRGEVAVLVETAFQGRGLGYALIQHILEVARSKGLKSVDGLVLRENQTMLQLAEECGFHRRADPDDPTVLRISARLDGD